MDKIYIRNMKYEDVDAVSRLITVGFRDKLKALARFSDDDIMELVKEASFNVTANFRFYYVAIKDDTVVGVMKLKTSADKEEYKFSIWSMFRKFGFIRMINTGILFFMMDEKVRRNELYIEMIVVDEQARGLGIGSQLLDYSKDLALNISDQQITSLSLHVIERNKGAIKLYERKGFNTVKYIKHWVLYRLSGIKGAYLMIKEIR